MTAIEPSIAELLAEILAQPATEGREGTRGKAGDLFRLDLEGKGDCYRGDDGSFCPQNGWAERGWLPACLGELR